MRITVKRDHSEAGQHGQKPVTLAVLTGDKLLAVSLSTDELTGLLELLRIAHGRCFVANAFRYEYES